MNVHKAVVAAGAPVSGCTVHLATDAYDAGPILLQRTCAVRPARNPTQQRPLASTCFEVARRGT